MEITPNIKDLIHNIRNKQVMLDRDLAELYGVSTKRLNEQVKRNIKRFPKDFMFQLTEIEKNELVAKCDHLKPLKFAPKTPYVFTEQGVAMLSGVLKSKKAIEVNIQIMRAFVNIRRFISKNAEIFHRLYNIDQKHIEYDKNFKKIFDAIEDKRIKNKQGIFYNGQVFDAHNFISSLIRSANKSIILIDNYINDSVLKIFTKRKKGVSISIYTKTTSQLRTDLKKYASQYGSITIKEFRHSHDRFMIIDNKEVYHIGASLKDLGRKWFAFSLFDKKALEILNKLEPHNLYK